MNQNLDDTLKVTRLYSWIPTNTQQNAYINEYSKLCITTGQFDLISSNAVQPFDANDIIFRIAKAGTVACEVITSSGSELVFDYKTLKYIER